MSAKYPMLQSLSRKLIAEFAASGRFITSDSCHYLMHAALGTVAPEVAAAKNIPIQVRASGMDDDRLQYNLYDTIRRAQTRLKIEEWPAIHAAEEVIHALRKARISVNQVQLFLDTAIPKKAKKDAFKALWKNLQLNDTGAEVLPKTATLAIEAGLIGAPNVTWEARFALAAAGTPVYPANGLVDRVIHNKCYLWPFPPTGARATDAATLDHYFGEYQRSAEMGMGFTIIQAPWPRDKYPRRHDGGVFHQYTLSTPIWSWHVNNGQWGLGNILYSRLGHDSSWHTENLKALLPRGLNSLPRIHACHQCRTLYIEKTPNHPDVPTSCSCKSTPGASDLSPITQPTS
ncbi:hypothetical protein [Pseudomonas syringae]|uniref:hypothetical protein n=1 Tax=Pseudomonas syringae TaxID=317 RepID=UPI003F751376